MPLVSQFHSWSVPLSPRTMPQVFPVWFRTPLRLGDMSLSSPAIPLNPLPMPLDGLPEIFLFDVGLDIFYVGLGFRSRLQEPIPTPAKALRARPRSRLWRPSWGAALRLFPNRRSINIFLSGTFISGIEKRFPKQETKQMRSLWNPARKIDYFVGVWSGKAKQIVFLRRIWTKTTGKWILY